MTTHAPGYLEALSVLAGLQRFGVRLGLERIERVLERLGSPQTRFATIHLAGTNGKGSTAAMLASCLRRAGYSTGLFTSPHLCRFTERIQVNGSEIAEESVAALIGRVLAMEPELTFFEVATAAALLHFAEQEVDFAVIETGLGGRLDATNVVRPRVAVLTSIDRDHVEVLGEDLAAIAAEKAGIIKERGCVVAAAQPPAVATVIAEHCRRAQASLTWVGAADNPDATPSPGARFEHQGPGALGYRGIQWDLVGLQAGLAGRHQRENAALCVATLEQLSLQGARVTEAAVRKGLLAARWPGRLEWIGEYLLDCAHNAAGARSLARAAGDRRDFCLIFGQLRDKSPGDVLGPLLPHSARLIFTAPPSGRATDPHELRQLVGAGEVATTLDEALAASRAHNGPKLVAGSVYLVGAVRARLRNERTDPVAVADPR